MMGGQGGAIAPPPVPGQAMYHVVMNGQSAGPFAAHQIQSGIAAGQVNKDTLVWMAGMEGWKKAGEVEELKGLFEGGGPSPPPVPAA
jgi:GYF domain 2